MCACHPARTWPWPALWWIRFLLVQRAGAGSQDLLFLGMLTVLPQSRSMQSTSPEVEPFLVFQFTHVIYLRSVGF